MSTIVNCLGVVVVDALSGPLQQYPQLGSRTVVTTDWSRFAVGGGAANTAAALAQLGVNTAIFSKVGDDLAGRFARAELERFGVRADRLVVDTNEHTPFTFVGVHPDGDRTFVHTPGANRGIALADFDLETLLQATFLVYQDFWAMPSMDGASAAELLRQARRRGVTTLLDECWGFGPNRATLEIALPHVDYFLPSLDDLRSVYPEFGHDDLIRLLHDRGAAVVVLKLGCEGCTVSTGRDHCHVPSFATDVVDTTGAGDCFDAGFIAGLTRGLSVEESAVVACRTAAACVAHPGGATGIPRLEELLQTCT